MIEQEDNIQHYIKGQLTGSELEAFENYLRENLEFQEEVRGQMLIHSASSQIRDEELKERMSAIEDQINTKASVNYKVFLRWAAVLLLVTLSLYYFIAESDKSNQDLYIAYFEPYPNVLGPTRDDNTLVIDGMVDYESEAYDQAVNKLTNSLVTSPQNDGIRLYLGISLMKTGRFKEAINAFEPIPDNSRFSNQSKWYISLAYLAQNNDKDAISLLKELEIDSSYSEQARKLLGEISS
jgi:tetratricopeptide (TPR) repeat protein